MSRVTSARLSSIGMRAWPYPTDTRSVAQRLSDPLPDADPDVLHRVMVIDLDVPFGLEREVQKAVPDRLVEHMVEERDARAYL